jgi:hypothetical protein
MILLNRLLDQAIFGIRDRVIGRPRRPSVYLIRDSIRARASYPIDAPCGPSVSMAGPRCPGATSYLADRWPMVIKITRRTPSTYQGRTPSRRGRRRASADVVNAPGPRPSPDCQERDHAYCMGNGRAYRSRRPRDNCLARAEGPNAIEPSGPASATASRPTRSDPTRRRTST